MQLLEALVVELHKEVKEHGVTAGMTFVKTFVMPARRNSSGLLHTGPDYSKPMALFLSVCLKMNMYTAAVVAALTQQSIPQQQATEAQDLSDLLPFLPPRSALCIMRYALKHKLPCLATAMLEAQPLLRQAVMRRKRVRESGVGSEAEEQL